MHAAMAVSAKTCCHGMPQSCFVKAMLPLYAFTSKKQQLNTAITQDKVYSSDESKYDSGGM